MNDFLRKNPAEKYITPIPDVDVRLPDIQFLAWRQGSAGPELPASAGYAQAVNWAVENGVTDGTSAAIFSPDTVCTRGHIVTFLYHAFTA